MGKSIDMPYLDARGMPDRLGAMVMYVVDARRWEALKPHLPSALLWLKDHVYILAEPRPGAQVRLSFDLWLQRSSEVLLKEEISCVHIVNGCLVPAMPANTCLVQVL